MSKRPRNDFSDPSVAARRRKGVFRDARTSGVQVSSEQLIKEAEELKKLTSTQTKVSTITLISPEETALYRQKIRSEFETKLKYEFESLKNWIQFANWEESQNDFHRARDIYERAMKFHAQRSQLWCQYAEMEQRHGFINNARAVWDRSLGLLPLSADLWFKAINMEYVIGNLTKIRELFRRWFRFNPESIAWKLLASFEFGEKNEQQCRETLQELVSGHNTIDSWLFAVELEHGLNNLNGAVKLLEEAIRKLPPDKLRKDSRIPLALVALYRDLGRIDDARSLFSVLLDSDFISEEILSLYTTFERQYGNVGSELFVLLQTRHLHQRRVIADPTLMSSWLSLYFLSFLIRNAQKSSSISADSQNSSQVQYFTSLSASESIPILEEAIQKTRKSSHLLPSMIHQQRAVFAIHLGQHYFNKKEFQKAKILLEEIVQEFPHDRAMCPRLWISIAELSQRVNNISIAREYLETAIEKCPCIEVFEFFLKMELSKNEEDNNQIKGDRCRHIFESFLRQFSSNPSVWYLYAQFEIAQGSEQRALAIYRSCIDFFREMAHTEISLTTRFQFFEYIDQTWALLLQLEERIFKFENVRETYLKLLKYVLDDYLFEFKLWRDQRTSEFFVPKAQSSEKFSTTDLDNVVPRFLPSTLLPSINRLQDAMETCIERYLSPQNISFFGVCKEEALKFIRKELFQDIIIHQREVIKEQDPTVFNMTQQEIKWLELSLKPIYEVWERFEEKEGNSESQKKFKDIRNSPYRRRVRLFK